MQRNQRNNGAGQVVSQLRRRSMLPGPRWFGGAISRLVKPWRWLPAWVAGILLLATGPAGSQSLAITAAVPGLVIRASDVPKRVFKPGEQRGLQERELRTRTPEGDAEMTFSGVALADLFDPATHPRGDVLAVAANGHTIGFSLDDAVSKGAFVAFAKNGRRLSYYGQGPYWIVFPWSDNPALDVPSVHAMSVWQLVELRIE